MNRLKILLVILGILLIGSGVFLVKNTVFKSKTNEPTRLIGFEDLKDEATKSAEVKEKNPKKEESKEEVKGVIQNKLTSPPPKITTPQPTPNKSQILQDKVNKALLDELEQKDIDQAWERFYSFKDAWRENPAQNCRDSGAYNYFIATVVLGGLEDALRSNYGKSLNWVDLIEDAFKSWCLDRGY